jgi:hypothetical protein
MIPVVFVLYGVCLRRLRTFFAKKVLRTPKNARGDSIGFGISPQFYNPSKSTDITWVYPQRV